MTPSRGTTQELFGIPWPIARPDQEGEVSPGHLRVGRYHLIERLGRGGQAEVWKAVRIEPPVEVVALKLLLPPGRHDPRKLARFRREAERGARLVGPALLPTYEFGKDRGVAFLAMPLIDGFALSTVLDQRRQYRAGRPPLHLHRLAVLPQPQYLEAMARVLAQVAWALDDVHGARVVHCDVKPSNIMLDRRAEERAYLIDFGMGRDLDAMPASPSPAAAGTPLYMAPEKLAGGPADEILGDIYALGATAFEALALRPPRALPEGLPRAQWTSYLAASPPPRFHAISPRLPVDLEAILARALARDPRRRYASAGAMAGDLERFLFGARPYPCRETRDGTATGKGRG